MPRGQIPRIRALQTCGRGGSGDSTPGASQQLLHEAGETHHRVFRIVHGADDDWASWYADWLINLSELPGLLGVEPVCSELTWLLVSLAIACRSARSESCEANHRDEHH